MSNTTYDRIKSVQENVDYLNYKYKGNYIWPYIKLYAGYQSNNKKGTEDTYHSKSKIATIKKVFKGGMLYLKTVLNKEKYPVLMLSAGHYKVEENATIHDKFLDFPIKFLKNKNINFKVIDFFNNLEGMDHVSYAKHSLPTQFVIYFLSMVWRIEFKLKKTKIEGDFNALRAECKKNGFDFKFEHDFKWRIFLLDKQYQFFKSFLINHRVEQVFTVCYYDLKSFAMVMAANKLNIPVIDMQHGVQGKYHIAYQGWPLDLQNISKLFPSHFWVWSNFDFENLKDTFPNKTILKGGNPWIESRIENKEKIYILFTSQGLEDNFPQHLIDSIQNYKGDLIWLIRLHPREIKNIEKIRQKLSDKQVLDLVEIEYATFTPLTDILAQTSIHITLSSTVVIEAYMFNIPSIVLDTLGEKYYKNQVPTEYLNTAYTEEEILSLIKNLEKTDFKASLVNSEVNKLSEESMNAFLSATL